MPDTPEYPAAWGPPKVKTVTYFDASVAAIGAGERSNLEILQDIVDGKLPPPPIASLFGSRLVEVSSGEAVFRCTPDSSTLNPMGLVHGGVLCTLLDSAAGVSVQSALPIGSRSASIEIKVSFLRPLFGDGKEIEVRGRALNVGTRVAFAEAHAHDGNGKLIGHATSSLAILRTEPATR